MYKFAVFLAIVAYAKAGYLHGNDHAIVEESFSSPLALPASLPSYAAPAAIYAPSSGGLPISFSSGSYAASAPIAYSEASYSAPAIGIASYGAPATIAFPAPSYAAPTIRIASYAASAPIYSSPAAALPISSEW